MKILCHAGPWSDQYLTRVCTAIEPGADVVIVSGHKSVDRSGIAANYYDFLIKNEGRIYRPTEKDHDFVGRCRLLRALDANQALLHLNSMRDAIRMYFDSITPDIFISETIDSFIMDLLFDEANNRGINSVGLVSCFVNGYFRVSARGEFSFLRTPSDEEVERVLRMMEELCYVPSFVETSSLGPQIHVAKRWLRNLVKPVYFRIKRKSSGEEFNYHYWATQITSTNWLHLVPKLFLGDKNWRSKASIAQKPIIYVPLQMFPEATVDYWCESRSLIDYDNILVEFISRHSPNYNFLVKEHPNVLGYRNPSLYRRLEALDNVTICPTTVNSNSVIEYCDAVLVWTGSVGFESALRSKPVITFCKPYYVSGDYFFTIDQNTNPIEINSFIAQQRGAITHTQKLSMMKHLLSGILPGKLIVDGSWNVEFANDRQAADDLGYQLQTHLPFLSRLPQNKA